MSELTHIGFGASRARRRRCYSPPYGDGDLFCMIDPQFLAPLIGCQALAFVTGGYCYWSPGGDPGR